MDTVIDNKRALTKAIVLLLKDFEESNGISVDFISVKNKPFIDKDGTVISAREIKTYYTENI